MTIFSGTDQVQGQVNKCPYMVKSFHTQTPNKDIIDLATTAEAAIQGLT